MMTRCNGKLSRLVLCLIAAALLGGVNVKDFDLLWSFEQSEELQSIEVSHVSVTRTTQFSTDGRYALRLDFEPVDRPQVEFSLATARADWRPLGALALDITNPSNEPIGFSLEVQDAIGATTTARTSLNLRAHEAASYAFPINSPSPLTMGMRGEPLIPGFRLMVEDHRPVDLAHIAKFRILLVNPKRPGALVVDNIRLVSGVSYDGIVDRFGQFALGEWSGKLESASEFGSQWNDEQAQLKSYPAAPDRDEYGGWASGPQFEAKGYFRVTRRDGKWWLITPSGHLFFSFGINSVNYRGGATVTEHREHMFQWLPASDDPLAAHYSVSHRDAPLGLNIKLVTGRTFRFYTANLERKYGADWRQQWKSLTLARLRAWGFNTIGNWSDPELYAERQVPYTATVDLEGTIADIPSGSEYWHRMFDPFDPAFAEAVDRSARRFPACRNDPWCLGYFVDNELSWGTQDNERAHYGLALGALSLGASSPAKRAFVDQIQRRYVDIGDFNTAWKANVSDWQQLLGEPFRPVEEFTEAMREDMHVFTLALARRYFYTIRSALKKYDPDHLYLGSRFASFVPESVEACSEFCDVVSFNIYQPSVDGDQWRFLDSLGKPVIVGEFHMGALDRGMFHPGLVDTPDQSARAEAFMRYVRSVIDDPALVGCHYFTYNDEPLTGRPGDGENYSIGFTTVVDGFYPEMTEAAKAISVEMYQRRSR